MSKAGHNTRSGTLIAGGAMYDITPPPATFLYGYPHTPRLSTGVHDRLLASALYLSNGRVAVLFVQVDLIWLPKTLVAKARTQIASRTGIASDHVMVTASHTHSGPVTLSMLSNAEDTTVPAPDPDYLVRVVDAIVSTAESAVRSAEAAEITYVSAACSEIGSNRLDANGPRITDVPIIAVRTTGSAKRWLGAMFVNPTHPTVLHEDSTLISGDFPAIARQHLQSQLLGNDCPVLTPLGAAGNQSPRHVIRENSIAEARRLGNTLGAKLTRELAEAQFTREIELYCGSTTVSLPGRQMPTVEEATKALSQARQALNTLKSSDAARAVIRTAECSVFGAEESLALARAAGTGALEAAQHACMPAEIQIIGIGDKSFVGWPGEVFVEFALELRKEFPEAIVITLANGELQGYLVTEDAVRGHCYEAGNAIFASPESGETLIAATRELLGTRSGSIGCAAAAPYRTVFP